MMPCSPKSRWGSGTGESAGTTGDLSASLTRALW